MSDFRTARPSCAASPSTPLRPRTRASCASIARSRRAGRTRRPRCSAPATSYSSSKTSRLATRITDAHLLAAIDTLAPFQRAFWDDVATALPFGASVTEAAQAWPPDAIAAHAAALHALDFGDVRELLPAWQARFTERVAGGRLTLCHGDYHVFGNILFAADAPPRVIDWSEVKPALPAHDVAYLLHAASPDRAHHEALLAHHARGLPDYPWPLCLWDFQLSLITNLLQAVHQRSATWLARNRALIALHDALAVLATPPPI